MTRSGPPPKFGIFHTFFTGSLIVSAATWFGPSWCRLLRVLSVLSGDIVERGKSINILLSSIKKGLKEPCVDIIDIYF